MFIIINLLDAVALVIHYLLTIYLWLIIIRALLSRVNPDPYNPIVVYVMFLSFLQLVSKLQFKW